MAKAYYREMPSETLLKFFMLLIYKSLETGICAYNYSTVYTTLATLYPSTNKKLRASRAT